VKRIARTDPARRWGLVAVAALVAAYAFVAQPPGHNQNAHFLLTGALAEHRATVDEVRGAPEELDTEDVIVRDGHYYAAKPPGLALASQPAYEAVQLLGVETSGDPTWPIWALHVWSVVLPAAVLLFLVMRLGGRLEPRLGATAAVTLGLATLVLPFATLFFGHLLATCLGFAAFALLWHERDGRARVPLVAAAGLLAGLAVTVDYPLGLVALVLGLYAVAGRRRFVQRALAYAGGLLTGVAPLFLFNWWAFGSPLELPYEGWHAPGDEPLPGVFGITLPRLDSALLLIVSPAGLAALAPAVVGTVLLYRRGRRAEALVIGALTVLYLSYNSAFVLPFAGSSPMPRYLIPILPFLAVPLVLAYRALPGVTVGLAAGASSMLVLYTITTPLQAWDGFALERLRSGVFVPTVLHAAGDPGAYAIVLFLGALAAAVAAALRSAGPRAPTRLEVVRGGVALVAWAAIVSQGKGLLDGGSASGSVAVIALLAAAVGAVATLHVVGPRELTSSETIAPART
jgi:hypothetical protein